MGVDVDPGVNLCNEGRTGRCVRTPTELPEADEVDATGDGGQLVSIGTSIISEPDFKRWEISGLYSTKKYKEKVQIKQILVLCFGRVNGGTWKAPENYNTLLINTNCKITFSNR